MTLTSLLDELITQAGSDLHLVSGEPPILRVDGALKRQSETPLDSVQMEAILLPHLTPSETANLEQRKDVEKSLRHEGHRFRIHVFRERGNLSAVIRVTPNRVPTLAELGLGAEEYPIFQDIVKSPRGLVLVVGPTGSGKMTTCAALVEEINQTRAERILTIEAPIEYEFVPKKSVITQQAVGEDVSDFPSALRAAMHSDPDVLLLREPQNLECFLLTMQLAETGHLVFTTLHANSASEAIQQLIELWPPAEQIRYRRMVAQNLVAIISQRLLPRSDRPGRVAIQEILIATPRIRQMIADGQTDLTVAIEAGRAQGMQTLDDNLIRLHERGIISQEIAWLHMENRDRLPKKVVG
jgi:twitching motility protein PilT